MQRRVADSLLFSLLRGYLSLQICDKERKKNKSAYYEQLIFIFVIHVTHGKLYVDIYYIFIKFSARQRRLNYRCTKKGVH